jgi:hypothetical protein
MILHTFTEEEKLRELLADWPSILRKQKKLSKYIIEHRPKWTIGINEEEGTELFETVKSCRGNTWHIGVWYVGKSKRCYHSITCEYESQYGTRAYLVLRGIKAKKPYYVEVTSHTISRVKERVTNVDGKKFFAENGLRNFLNHSMFDSNEIGVFFKYGDRDEDGVFTPKLDKEGNIRGIVMLHNSHFQARITPKGNYIFKTYFPIFKKENPEGSLKNEFITFLYCFWTIINAPCVNPYYEPRLKEWYQAIKNATVDQRIDLLIKLCPKFEHLLHNIDHFDVLRP